jgi:cytochrome b6-f complex iron-sulfur subunit
MEAADVLLIAIPVVIILAAVVLIATSRRRDSGATLHAEARRRDRRKPAYTPGAASASDLTTAARDRADASKELVVAGAGTVATRGTALARRDPDEVAVSRRQFFNRGIVGMMGLSLGGFGAASVAFLWPPKSEGGFGSAVKTPESLDDIKASITEKRVPFYVPEARSYLVIYPAESLEAARTVYEPRVVEGMEKLGVTALYQKCVHLGCRVPWCDSSQWFECPCHGSKYNRVGEKRGGPAPRGLDRWPIDLNDDGTVTINTGGTLFAGPVIGTDTTSQQAEGPACV